MNHQHYSPQVNAGIFSMKLSDWVPRVPERAQRPRTAKVWVSSKASRLFLTDRHNSDGDDWTLRPNRHFIPFHRCFSADFSQSRKSDWTQTVTKLNPMFGYGVPQSALELVAQPMWECAPPSLPPSSLPFSTVCGPPRNRKFTFCFS